MDVSNQHNIKYTFICTVSLIPTRNVYFIFCRKYHVIIIYKNRNIYLTGTVVLNCCNKLRGIDELPYKINLSFVSAIYLFILWYTPNGLYMHMNYRLRTINFTGYIRSHVGTSLRTIVIKTMK